MTSAAERFTAAQRDLALKGVHLSMRPGEYEVRAGKSIDILEDLDEAIVRGHELAGLRIAPAQMPEDVDAANARVRHAAIPERPMTVRELRRRQKRPRTAFNLIRARRYAHNVRYAARKFREALCPSSEKTTRRD
jgi:hypothetical protein